MKKLFIKMLVSSIGQSKLFKEMRDVVEAWSRQDISGVEKRDAVLQELKEAGVVASSLILNVLLELSVLWVASR